MDTYHHILNKYKDRTKMRNFWTSRSNLENLSTNMENLSKNFGTMRLWVEHTEIKIGKSCLHLENLVKI